MREHLLRQVSNVDAVRRNLPRSLFLDFCAGRYKSNKEQFNSASISELEFADCMAHLMLPGGTLSTSCIALNVGQHSPLVSRTRGALSRLHEIVSIMLTEEE